MLARLACVLLLAALLAGCSSSDEARPARAAAFHGDLIHARLGDDAFGWAVRGDYLVVTRDGGESWTNATPEGVDETAGMKGVYFVDDHHGWVVTAHTGADERTQLVVERTADGGRTWTATSVARPAGEFTDLIASKASVVFVSPEQGWMLVPLPTSSQFSRGRLFTTGDGGATWTELAAPAGGGLFFLDATNGWLYSEGGPPKLYRTRDGGRTWHEAR